MVHSTVSFSHKNIFAINHNTLTMQDLNLLSLQMHHNKLLLSWLPLLLLSLLPVVASVIDGNTFKDMIEELSENSLGVKEIQVDTYT